MSDTDERIIERFLTKYRKRRCFDPELVRTLLIELYPALASRLEIVAVGDRLIVVKRRSGSYPGDRGQRG